MAQSVLELILQAKKQGGDVVKQASSDLAGFVGSAAAATKAMLSNKDANKDAANALRTFGVDLGALSNPLTTTAELLKQSVTAAANWGDSMGDLAQLTGGTVRETSQMAASLELVGVKTATLEQALKSMTKNGLALNMSSLKDLSRQYQALQDPIARNEFLFKNFGKAGLEMAEIMGKSADELDRLERVARSSGKVIGEEAAANAEEFNLQMAIFNQRVEGAQIALGNTFLPVLNTAATAFDQLVTIWQIGNVKLREQRGEIDGATAALEMQRIAGIEPATTATETNTAATQDATVATDAWMQAFVEGAPAITTYMGSLDNTSRVAAGLKMGMNELTTATLYHQAAAGLDGTASLELARAMGLIDEKAYAAAVKVEDLRTKYDSNRDGAIDATEAAAGYTREILELAKATDLIPRTIPIDIRVTKYGDEDFGGWTPPKGSTTTTITATTGNEQYGDARALGGPTFAGVPNVVNESALTRPEVFVSDRNGFMLTRQDAQAALSGGNGSVTVIVNYAPTMSLGDEVEFETRVIPLIKSKLRL